MRAVRPRLGGGTGSVARGMRVGNFHPTRMVWVVPDAVRCSMRWVQCWDCIAWDSYSADYCARLILTLISIEVRKTGKSSEYNTMPSRSRAGPAQDPGNTGMGSMQPLFCWWCLMFGSSSHDDGRSCWIGKPAHSPLPSHPRLRLPVCVDPSSWMY